MFHRIRNFISGSIRRRDFATRVRSLVFRTKWVKTVRFLIRQFFEDKLLVRASALTYSSLLSIVPVLAIVFLIFKGFGLRVLEPVLSRWLAPLGPSGDLIAAKLMEFVANAETGALGVFGVLALLFSAVSILDNIEESYNDIWHIRRMRSWRQRIATYLSLMVIAPLTVVLIFALTASLSSDTLIQYFFDRTELKAVAGLGLKLLPYILSSMLFALLIRYVPNTRVSFRAVLIGGGCSGIGWQALNWGFAQFIVGAGQTGTRDILFAGFAALPLFLLWMYLSWVIILLGVELAYVIQHIPTMEWRELEKRHGNVLQRFVGLRAVLEIVRQSIVYGRDLTIEALARNIQTPEPVLRGVLEPIVEAGILTPVGNAPAGYMFTGDPHLLKVADVLQAFQGAFVLPELLYPHDEAGMYVEQLLRQIDTVVAEGPGAVSVYGAALATDPSPETATIDLTEEIGNNT